MSLPHARAGVPAGTHVPEQSPRPELVDEEARSPQPAAPYRQDVGVLGDGLARCFQGLGSIRRLHKRTSQSQGLLW